MRKIIALSAAIAAFSSAPVMAEADLAPSIQALTHAYEDNGYLMHYFPTGVGVDVMDQLAMEVDDKSPEAYFKMALIHLAGEGGIKQSRHRGVRFLKKSAKAGYPEAGHVLGELYERGHLVMKSDRNAVKWKGYAARGHHVEAMLDMGDYYLKGVFVWKDVDKAASWYRRAADHGSLEAVERLANLFESQDNPAESFRYHKQLADAGNLRSLKLVSDYYRDGYGVEKDAAKALSILMGSPLVEEPEVMYDIAQFHLDGEGVEVDVPLGMEWLDKAARGGFTPAYFMVGEVMLFDEDEANDEKGIALLEVASNRGHAMAKYLLGQKYAESRCSVRSARAEHYLQEAHDLGVVEASILFSDLLIEGELVEPDKDKAYQVLLAAKDKPESAFKLYKLAEELEEESLDHLRTAAAGGVTEAQYLYGKGLLSSKSASKREKGMSYLKLAAEKSMVPAMYHYGVNKLKDSPEEGIPYLIEASVEGHAEAMLTMGHVYAAGMGRTQDNYMAYDYFKRAAELGNAEAQYEAGMRAYFGEGILVNDKEAIRYLSMASKNGHAESNYYLGQIYEDPSRMYTDVNTAIRFYKKAHEAGHGPSGSRIGVLLAGQGMYTDALPYLEVAVDDDDVSAKEAMGMMLLNGRGVEKDEDEAFDLILDAAEAGSLTAAFNVAVMYADGTGTGRDYDDAYEWMLKVAEAGDPEAQVVVATMLFDGKGVQRNLTEAYRWAYLANKKTNNSVRRYTDVKLMIASKIDDAALRTLRRSLESTL